MTPEEMPIVEPVASVRFGSRRRLMAHVEKHLIEGRDERWQHVLDESLLLAARLEYRNGRPGPALDALARRYQAFVGRRLVRLCEQGRSHQHSCRYAHDLSDLSQQAVSQVIDAWPEQEKLIIAAAAFVRGEQVGAYKLLTAFRPWPRLSASGHRRKGRERLRNLQTIYPRRVLQLHDERERKRP